MTDTSQKDKEIADLRQRLKEAEDTLQAIAGGGVDALVVQTDGGEQVFTLEGADAVYRNAIENINEAILSLSPEGIILYSNHYFAKMVKADLNTIIGTSIFDFVDPQYKSLVASILEAESGRDEITLQSSGNKTRIPAYIAVNKLQLEKITMMSVVITDLTQQKHSEEVMATGKLIQGINSIFYEYLAKSAREDLGIACLKIVEELTQSVMGFITENPLNSNMKSAAESPRWAVYSFRDKSSQHPPLDLANMDFYSRYFTDGRSVIVNNLKERRNNSTPSGHPAIHSFLGVTLKHHDRIFGVLGLANRKGGYGSHETRMAESLGPAIVEVLLRKKAEEELVKYRDRLEQLVAERTRDLRSLAHRLVDIQEQERSLIGSSLHDEIGQVLTYTTLLIDKAIRKPDVKMLEEAKRTVQEAIAKIRDLSSMLSPGLLRSAGLAQAISSLVDDYTRRTKINVDFKTDKDLAEIPEDVALACYRIVQESLTNTIRHAQATTVKVTVSYNTDNIRLEITDNGVGFKPEKMKRTTGLTGMRERAVALGGEFTIESSPGQGTRITTVLPLSERKEEC